MADFQETARIKIKELSSTKASVRREAAYYLGEAGVDEAITKLATVYKNDPDKSVRKAAGYALGMFKAVEQALNEGREEEVVELLRGIVDEGKMGKRRSGGGAFVFFEFVLVLLLVGLIAANLFLPGLKPLPFDIPGLNLGGDANNASTMNPQDRAALIEGMRPTFTGVFNDANTFMTQFQSALTGGALDCTVYINNAAPYVAPPMMANADADLRTAAEALNSAQTQIGTVYARFDQACGAGGTVPIEEVGGQLAALRNALGSLAVVQNVLMGSGGSAQQQAPTAAAPQETAVPPTVTPIPETPTPTVIVPVVDASQHFQPLYGIIDTLRDPRGPNGLLEQYWRDAQSAGVTNGCDQTQPEIPADYVLTAEEAQTLPTLKQAVDQINLALNLTRQNWQFFQTACSAGALSERASAGQQAGQTVDEALRVAEELLNNVRNSQ